MSTSPEERELQARIEQLSVEIELQKEVLQELELSKIGVQRQLNAIRDPMARSPLELSSEIFLQCLPLEQYSRKPDAATPRMLLMNVCNAWTDIALSTPALWAGTHLEHPDVEILDVWLRRAQNHSSTISLHNSFDNADLQVDVDTLAGLGAFSRLQSLVIETEQYEGWQAMGDARFIPLDIAEVIGFLRLAPNLTDCSLHNVNLSGENKEALILPRLRSLKLGKHPWSNDGSDDRVLAHLSLPVLETLTLPYTRISGNDLSLFLKRSSPPLQRLTIGGWDRGLVFTELDGWLRLVPTLTYLDLATYQRTESADDFFPALGDPHLHQPLRQSKMDVRGEKS
ncbi:hypothetical protein C8R47DRAFT_1071548 [Mycena vitilis]|nr:hypothetical protein C8R47DRAFT_1071548 [Mycena vitilis]